MTSTSPGVADFFSTARERQAIYLRRRAGLPHPWTDDPVMREYSVTNLFREQDKTTRWFRENVRDPLATTPEVLLATVVFRWFNRIQTGEAIFRQEHLPFGMGTSHTAWDHFLRIGDTGVLREAIVAYCGRGPYVTGAYIILGQQGMPKLDGVLACLDKFNRGVWDFALNPGAGTKYGWRDVAEWCLKNSREATLEGVWRWLRQVPYLGDFMAYEIVTDLRHTDLLWNAPDVNTWANPGPGAARGLHRVYGRRIQGNVTIDPVPPKSQMIAEMRELLEMSRDPRHWPQWRGNIDKGWLTNGYILDWHTIRDGMWPAWELHEVEMWLCEYQKIVKTRLGEGRPRGKFRTS